MARARGDQARFQPLLPMLTVAVATLALPLVGALLAGIPLAELLHLPLTARGWDPLGPNLLFTSSVATLALALLTAAGFFAWPRRAAGHRAGATVRGRIPRLIWLGVFALLLAVITAEGQAVNATGALVVVALTLFANADTERRTGSCLITQQPGYFRSLFAASLGAGWLFYWLNLYLQLWVYPPAAELVPFVLGKSLDYAVLLPALLSLRQWLASFPRMLQLVSRAKPLGLAPATAQGALLLLLLAVLGLVGAALWRDWIYPLTLTAPLLMALGLQQLRARPTPFAGVRHGDWSRILLPAAAALFLAVVAQGLNLLLGPAWAIQLPLLGGPQFLGLPLPGWVWLALLGPFGVWLGDQVTEPWKQRPQQPTLGHGFPMGHHG